MNKGKKLARRGAQVVPIVMPTVCPQNEKYVVNHKLKHFDDVSFREIFGRIKSVFFLLTK